MPYGLPGVPRGRRPGRGGRRSTYPSTAGSRFRPTRSRGRDRPRYRSTRSGPDQPAYRIRTVGEAIETGVALQNPASTPALAVPCAGSKRGMSGTDGMRGAAHARWQQSFMSRVVAAPVGALGREITHTSSNRRTVSRRSVPPKCLSWRSMPEPPTRVAYGNRVSGAP